VDYFVAQETLEALRWLEFLRPGGTVVLSEQQLPPTSTVYGKDVYPEEADALSAISELAGGVLLIDAVGIAEALGNRRAANSVLLGALSSKLEVSPEDWLAVLENKVPQRHKEVNRKAFNAGREGQWELKQVPG
jgi:indolepyruvate ferredoxin oxidoreductase beta subunit